MSVVSCGKVVWWKLMTDADRIRSIDDVGCKLVHADSNHKLFATPDDHLNCACYVVRFQSMILLTKLLVLVLHTNVCSGCGSRCWFQQVTQLVAHSGVPGEPLVEVADQFSAPWFLSVRRTSAWLNLWLMVISVTFMCSKYISSIKAFFGSVDLFNSSTISSFSS